MMSESVSGLHAPAIIKDQGTWMTYERNGHYGCAKAAAVVIETLRNCDAITISRFGYFCSPLHKLLKASARSHFAIAEILRT